MSDGPPGKGSDGPPGYESDGRIANISAAVLLGGASSRMGRDKAHVELDGLPLAAAVARVLAGLFEEVLLVGGDPPAGAPGRRVPDPAGPQCALRGLVGALEAARSEHVLVVATDLPGLGPELPLALVAAPEAHCVAPETERGVEPLCALYRRDAVLPVARQRLAAGRLALHGLLDALEVETIAGAGLRAVDRGGAALVNVNTPEELEAFRRGTGSSRME